MIGLLSTAPPPPFVSFFWHLSLQSLSPFPAFPSCRQYATEVTGWRRASLRPLLVLYAPLPPLQGEDRAERHASPCGCPPPPQGLMGRSLMLPACRACARALCSPGCPRPEAPAPCSDHEEPFPRAGQDQHLALPMGPKPSGFAAWR